MNVEEKITTVVENTIREQAGQPPKAGQVVLQRTRKDFEGDLTLVVFPFVKALRRSPEQCAALLGEAIVRDVEAVTRYNVVKGFLNLTMEDAYWHDFLRHHTNNDRFGLHDQAIDAGSRPVVVEYSSPNTNKPLHLGHIRNNLLGWSVARILQAAGRHVKKVNLVNDRGIHICKSMLAWMKAGEGETLESAGKKGDKLVGDYYVKFEEALRNQVKELMESQGMDEETARDNAPLMEEARELLRRWENRDPEVMKTWRIMNGWVYQGFDETYERMGIDFDKVYYESDTYLLGRDIVMEGLKQDLLYKKEDGSVWADLSGDNLDEKLLLRADGTSVYMTQDIGTAQLRYDDFHPEKMVYVVGNEQNHHFQVLRKVLKKLGKPYADAIHHMNYGMVELPYGRMKSREGTVVDADDLMDEMVDTARKTTEELGKTQNFDEAAKKQLYHQLGLGAIKYFILKVDPKKNMLFNPEESIDFNGNTGPFIQYTHARICSVQRHAGPERVEAAAGNTTDVFLHDKEKQLLKSLYDFPGVVMEAADEMSPARVANYVYDLCKEFNQFYHDHSILNEPDRHTSDFRLRLAGLTAVTVRNAMTLLGIDVPEKM